MTARIVALVAAVSAGGLLLFLYGKYRTRGPASAERLQPEDFGLELIPACCAFVVFTTRSCRPCKAALRVIGEVVQRHRDLTEIKTVDATDSADLSVRYGVRAVPTIFLITASGHVVRRWNDVPALESVELALKGVVDTLEPAGSRGRR